MTAARRPRAASAVVAVVAIGAAVLIPKAAFAALPGPLGPADLDFLTKAHAAVAYGTAASELVCASGAAAQVKDIGKRIMAADKKLAGTVERAATTLQIRLAAGSGTGLDDLKAVDGAMLDTVYVQRLRATDGTLLEAAVAIRVRTRNAVIRGLAAHTAMVMMQQIPLLERSGLVDYSGLPAASVPSTRRPGPGPRADPGMLAEARVGHGVLWPSIPVALGVFAAGLLGALGASRRLGVLGARWRPKRAPRPRSRRRPGPPDGGSYPVVSHTHGSGISTRA